MADIPVTQGNLDMIREYLVSLADEVNALRERIDSLSKQPDEPLVHYSAMALALN